MSKKLVIISIFVLFYFGILFYQGCRNAPTNNSNNSTKTQTQTGCPTQTAPFPSFSDKDKYAPPDWYCREYNDTAKRKDFPIYRLSQDYAAIPATFPEVCDVKDCPWKAFDFKTQPREYLQELIKYAYKNNLETDWANPKDWFSAPYMHLDTLTPEKNIEPTGREFMHGLTMERVGCKAEIDGVTADPNCKFATDIYKLPEGSFYNWAVSFYNARGGSYINKVWTEVLKEKPEDRNLEVFREGFSDGAVAVKLLFTRAKVEDAKYLEKSVEWQADVERRLDRENAQNFSGAKCLKNGVPAEECFPKVRLLQIDIAVRDNRAEQTGWVFGTFIYKNDAPRFIEYKFKDLTPDEVAKKEAWLRLVPLGLIYGNGEKIAVGASETESYINPNIGVTQHFGCNLYQTADGKFVKQEKRLNGPVDNPQSSCLSCHAVSETPDNLNPNSVPYAKMGCAENKIAEWFRNINPRQGETFSSAKNIFTLDYSLQLREGIFRRWLEAQNCYNNPQKCPFADNNQAENISESEKVKTILSRSGIQKVQ